MSIGSVSVDVVPDATGFAEKLKAKLKDVNVKVGVNLDAEKAKASLDRLAMTKRSVTIKAEADTKAAKARLDELARTRTAKVRASIDRSSFSQASSSISGLTSDLFSLKGGIVALGPALIPVTAAVAGLAGALASPLIAAGGGLGIFGAITVGALAKAKKDAKDIADLNKKATAATDPKAAAAFSKQADALMKSLPKAEQAFLRAKGSISKGFDELLAKSGGAVFGPLTKGAKLLGSVLPRLSPVVDAFGAAISDMLDQLGRFSRGSGFTSVITFLSTTGVSAFKQLASISKNVAVGLGGMVAAFSPLGTTVLGSLDKLTARFAAFGQNAGSSSGFARFMSYVRTVGPQVGQTIRDVSVAVGHLVLALAPQGDTMLAVIDGLARGVSKLSPGKIAAIAGAVGALGLATGKFGKLTSLTLLVSAVSYAYKHSSAFHKLADGAAKFAQAINSLPQGVKIGLGAASTAAVLSRKNVAGSVVSKVLGGGVQKVFVVNMGKGGLTPDLPGKPGKPTKPGAPAPTGSNFATEAAKIALVSVAATLGVNAALKTVTGPKGSGKAFTQKDINNSFASNAGGASGGQMASPFSAKDFIETPKKAADANAKLKASLVDTGRASRLLGQEVFGTATQLKRSGLTAKDYGAKLHTLPKGVQTKVTTPGAVTSKAQVLALAKQYNLTPKQVRTLMQLSGASRAIAQAREVRATLAAIRDKTATITINRVTNQIVNKRKAQDLVNRADGGWIHGPGTSRSDSIPAMLSNGEFVVNAASARRNAELLQAINGNTRRTANSQNYATGGSVRSSGGVTVNYNAPVYAHDPDDLARKQAARDRVAMVIAGGP